MTYSIYLEHIIYRTSDTNSSNSSHTSRNSNLVYCSRCTVMSDFSHLLLVLNSSVNIIIYGWKDKKFRELLLKLFNLECFVKTNSVREGLEDSFQYWLIPELNSIRFLHQWTGGWSFHIWSKYIFFLNLPEVLSRWQKKKNSTWRKWPC